MPYLNGVWEYVGLWWIDFVSNLRKVMPETNRNHLLCDVAARTRGYRTQLLISCTQHSFCFTQLTNLHSERQWHFTGSVKCDRGTSNLLFLKRGVLN